MRSTKLLLTILVLVLGSTLSFAQNDIMRQARADKFALTNATIYTVTNGVIENGTIVISNGIIEAVGANVTIPTDAIVIDYEGQEIYRV